jgi:hypothetical protein
MSGRVLAAIFTLEVVAFSCLGLALLDRRAHQQVQTAYGVNQWGYRDEPRGSKEPGERRVALVGGSSAFEAGLAQPETLTSNLFVELRAAGAARRQEYSVVNLSEPAAPAGGYADAIRHYAFLDPDAVCIFDGYDMPAGPPPHGREQSLVFRAVGYLPVLPSRILRHQSWMSDADGGVAGILKDGRDSDAEVSCAGAGAGYCRAIGAAVRTVLDQKRAVMVVSPPSVSARHLQQQRSLAASLQQEFGDNPRFMYLDLTASMDLADPVHSPDRIHRTNIGNHVVGQRIASALLKWPVFAGGAAMKAKR